MAYLATAVGSAQTQAKSKAPRNIQPRQRVPPLPGSVSWLPYSLGCPWVLFT